MYLPPQTDYYFKGKLKVIVLNFDVTQSFAKRKEPICPPPVAEFDNSLLFDQNTLDIEIAPVIKNSGIRADLLEIVHAFNKADDLANAYVSTLLKKVIIEIIKDVANENNSDRLIERIRRYIKLHCGEIESNEDIAEKFGYHPVYLASLFKERTGITLHKLILAERVNLACTWLEKTELSIDEIAFNAGFSTRNHFCTVFKKFMNISPLVYRKRNK
jgi:AraC-like DNA-binding protein